GYEELDFLGFNVNSCNDFTGEQLNKIKSMPVIFTIPFQKDKYDSYKTSYICRTHARPLSRYSNATQSDTNGFLENFFIGDDERGDATGEYTSFLNIVGQPTNMGYSDINNHSFNAKLGGEEIFALTVPANNEYGRISKNDLDSNITGLNSIKSYCEYVDNLFLYQDAEIDNLSFFRGSDFKTASFPNKAAADKPSDIDTLIASLSTDKKPGDKAPGYGECMSAYAEKPEEKESVETTLCLRCDDGTKTSADITSCMDALTDVDCSRAKKQKECEQNNAGEKKYFLAENVVKNSIVDCAKFFGKVGGRDGFFDCNLYRSYDGGDIENLAGYITKLPPVLGVSKLSDIIIAKITETCDGFFKTTPAEVNIVPNPTYSCIKPYITVENCGPAPGKNIIFPPTQQKNQLGCMTQALSLDSIGLPFADDDSFYISEKNSSEGEEKDKINGILTLDKNNFEKLKFKTKVCMRSSPNLTNSSVEDKCGAREGVVFGDFCVEYNLEDNSSYTTGLLNTLKKSAGISTGGEKYDSSVISKDTGRNVYFINSLGTSDRMIKGKKTPANPYLDAPALKEVTKECYAGSALIPIPFCLFPLTCPIGLALMYVAANDCISDRSSEYEFNLEKGVYQPYNYLNATEDPYLGYLTPVTITNNDNFFYQYYPRSVKIEEDLKNKLTANVADAVDEGDETEIDTDAETNAETNTQTESVDIAGKGNYFRSKNMKSNDIISACDISDFIKDKNGCLTDESKDCEFTVKDYTNSSSSAVCSKTKYWDCLTDAQKECLNSYGVTIADTSIGNTSRRGYLLKDGAFLKAFKDKTFFIKRINGFSDYFEFVGDIITSDTTKRDSGDKDWVPINFIPLTRDNREDSELSKLNECKLTDFGDFIGDPRNCRGFKYGNVFYTESQSTKKPLLTAPPPFYMLITPDNMRELFLPSLFMKRFYNLFGTLTEAGFTENKILNFFSPKMQFDYDMLLSNNDPEYENFYSVRNQNPEQGVVAAERYSLPYELKYRKKSVADESSDLTKKFIFEKTLDDDAKNGLSIPYVCLHIIMTIPSGGQNDNFCLKEITGISDAGTITRGNKTGACEGASCFNMGSGNCLKLSEENNLFCYERAFPTIDSFIIKPDAEMSLFYPMINVYVKPNTTEYRYAKDFEKAQFVFVNETNITLNGINKLEPNKDTAVFGKIKNETQGLKLTFERSYCSRKVFDYYKLNDIIQREENKSSLDRDRALIKNSKTSLSAIETSVFPYCDTVGDGMEEILDNRSEMKPLKDMEGQNQKMENVIYIKTVQKRKRSDSFGSFNEICLTNTALNIMAKKIREQTGRDILENVIVFKDAGGSSYPKKCLLSDAGLSKTECLYGNEVYVAGCSQNDDGCDLKFNITARKFEYVKKINCLETQRKIAGGMNVEMIIDEVRACYKGGFNKYGIIREKDDADNVAAICDCELQKNKPSYNKNLFAARKITAREMGFCVDLADVISCPAVKYFDNNNHYSDDSLVLGLTQSEAEKIDIKNYEQHLWRTSEKQYGVVPSSFFTHNLGNAEFPKSYYCANADDCLGGKKDITGECRGFWNYNGNNPEMKPVAVCEKYTHNGEDVYEYKLKINPCKRFECSEIAGANVDELDIYNNTSNVFKSNEILNFVGRVKQSPVESNENDEEGEITKVDKRGSDNGFASWAKIISMDFAQEITATSCLTGFAPYKSNYNVAQQLQTNGNYENTKYIDYNKLTLNGGERDKFVALVDELQEYINSNIIKSANHPSRKGKTAMSLLPEEKKPNLPQRRCNQIGEWMTVDDIYNNQLRRGDVSDDEKYYYKNSKAWFPSFSEGTTLSKNASDSGYCERLVCPAIAAKNINAYNIEYYTADDAQKTENNRVWNFTGGADWDELSAPRNSSYNLSSSVNIGNKLGKSVSYIFSDSKLTSVSNYKFMKKAKGICQTDYGFFNRGVGFGYSDFDGQLGQILSARSLAGSANSQERFQDYLLIDSAKNYGQTKPPERGCSDHGIWFGIKNNCVRSCEMMDIYHAEYDARLYSANDDSGVRVENHDVKRAKFELSPLFKENNESREEFFQRFNLADKKFFDESIKFTRGDYITGGAQWPRTVVFGDDPVEVKTDANYFNRKYVEVEGECDSTFEGGIINDEDVGVRTYIRMSTGTGDQSVGIKPKRRCYEDGVWGPVDAGSRCVLSRNCVDFKITPYNLYYILKKASSGVGLLDLNKEFNGVIISNDKKENVVKIQARSMFGDGLDGEYVNRYNDLRAGWQAELYGSIGGSNNNINVRNLYIATLKAKETIVGQNLSNNPIEFDSKDFGQNNTAQFFSSANAYHMVCNVSQMTDNYAYGWNFNSINIEKYFIPMTCENADLSSSVSANLINFKNRGETFANYNGAISGQLHYARETFLEFLYDKKKIDEKNGSVNNDDPLFVKLFVDDTEGSPLNDAMSDVTHKTVKIMGNNYFSYQVKTVCDSKLFFNAIDSEKGTDLYYRKSIVLECGLDSLGSLAFRYPDERSADVIKYEDCKPRTCGGNGSYQKNWSKSVLTQLKSDIYGTLKYHGSSSEQVARTTTFECDAGRALVLKNLSDFNGLGSNKEITYYKDNNGNEYKNEGFVSKIITDCDSFGSGANSINGTTIEGAGANSYDAYRFGKIDLNGLLVEFCSDLEKTNCKIPSEQEIANSAEWKSNYCVPMRCYADKLVLVLDTKNEAEKIIRDETATQTFGFKEDASAGGHTFVNFGNSRVIESVSGDFTIKDKIVSTVVGASDIISSLGGAAATTASFGNLMYSDANGVVSNTTNVGVCPDAADLDLQTLDHSALLTDYNNQLGGGYVKDEIKKTLKENALRYDIYTTGAPNFDFETHFIGELDDRTYDEEIKGSPGGEPECETPAVNTETPAANTKTFAANRETCAKNGKLYIKNEKIYTCFGYLKNGELSLSKNSAEGFTSFQNNNKTYYAEYIDDYLTNKDYVENISKAKKDYISDNTANNTKAQTKVDGLIDSCIKRYLESGDCGEEEKNSLGNDIPNYVKNLLDNSFKVEANNSAMQGAAAECLADSDGYTIVNAGEIPEAIRSLFRDPDIGNFTFYKKESDDSYYFHNTSKRSCVTDSTKKALVSFESYGEKYDAYYNNETKRKDIRNQVKSDRSDDYKILLEKYEMFFKMEDFFGKKDSANIYYSAHYNDYMENIKKTPMKVSLD
ncbi:MAG: hypothetical protein LBB09_03790, partial [Rickettsiales bacterium]|nr:hypothetical protein [Rickettsiales bacterium]